MSRFAILTAGLLVLAACDNNKPTDPRTDEATSKNSTTNATQPATPAAVPTVSDDDLATRADFDESAEKAISKANYKAELSALETEIAKED